MGLRSCGVPGRRSLEEKEPMRMVWSIRACGMLVSVSMWAAPYCLLRKSTLSGPPCFEFYLADTAKADPLAVPGATCVLTPLAIRQGWRNDPTFLAPLPDWRTGDLAMGEVS